MMKYIMVFLIVMIPSVLLGGFCSMVVWALNCHASIFPAFMAGFFTIPLSMTVWLFIPSPKGKWRMF